MYRRGSGFMISMEHLAPHPQIPECVSGKEHTMLDSQRLAPCPFGILAIPVVNIGEGPAGARGHDNHSCNNASPEEEVFQAVQYTGDSRLFQVSIVKYGDGHNGRQPDSGCEIMDETIKDNQGFFKHDDSQKATSSVCLRCGKVISDGVYSGI